MAKRHGWRVGAWVCSLVVVAAWGSILLMGVTDPLGGINTLFPLFGIANQLLAVVALAVVGSWLIKSGRGRYLPVVAIPMIFVLCTTMSAGTIMVGYRFPDMIRDPKRQTQGILSLVATLFVIISVLAFLAIAASKWVVWLTSRQKVQDPAGGAAGTIGSTGTPPGAG